MSESIVQMLPELDLGHFPGEPVPVPEHPLGAEPFPNTQPDPPLSQLHALPSGPVAVPREQSSAPAPPLPSEGAAGRHEASPQPALLWAEQTKGHQPLLIPLSL